MPAESSIHFCGMIMHRIRTLLEREDAANPNLLTISEVRQEHYWGMRHAWLQLQGEPLRYHLILVPEGAPIQINGVPVENYISATGGSNDQR